MSFRLDDSWLNWTEPIPMTASINSTADEGQPFLHESSGYLYFISNRDGSSDIFRSHFHNHKNSKHDNSAMTYTVSNSKTQDPIAATPLYQFYTNKPINDTTISALNPLKLDNKISLNSIYFRRSKAEILPASFPALDHLVKMMNTHINIHIQIKGHTDNIGNKHDLFILSEKRAYAVRRYLIEEGIKSFRITSHGYGDEIPITDNSTEEKRALNRRVEVVITKA